MKMIKKLLPAVVSLAIVGAASAEPVAALAPQSVPPEAMRAIDAMASENTEVPLLDHRVLSIGLGALAGVIVHNMLPGGMIVARTVPAAVGRMGAAITARTIAGSQFSMMTSAVLGSFVGDYLYRKNSVGRMPSVPADVVGRIRP
ncbi:membrane hypothetical protein [Gammaproteobacteria bacterium]